MRFVRNGTFVLLLLLTVAARAQSTLPTALQPIPSQSVLANGTPTTVDLRSYFGLPGVTGQVAQIDTVMGRINLELFANDAPRTVANFLNYISSGRYQNTFIHRAVTGFVVQGGGFTATVPINPIQTFPPVQNEFRLGNVRGTVAMAKQGGDPNSATSQWFFNLADNRANLDNQNGGFTVFARVIGAGMDVVDAIAALPYFNVGFDPTGSPASTPLRNVPAGETQLRTQYFVTVTNVRTLPVYPSPDGGSAVLSFAATSSAPAIVTAAVSGPNLTLTPVAVGSASVTVTVTDSNNRTASSSVLVTVTPGASASRPVIVAQPQAEIRMASGTVNTVVFSVGATGTPTPTYQWRRNGNPVTGQISSTYVLTNASDAQAGRFTCVVSNSEGSVESDPAVLSFIAAPSPSRLVNLSILADFAAGESLTMGSVLGGPGTSGNKALLARAVGPSLQQFQLTGFLPDPQMSLVTGGATVASNNDWGGSAGLVTAFDQVGAFRYTAANSRDAAIFQPSLAPGSYTVQVSDGGGVAGRALAELYDSTPDAAFTAATPRLVNVSVLKQISAGAGLTAGFVVSGTTAKTVLVRAIGPGLAAFNVSGPMADPQLRLFASGATKIAENDNWGGDAQLTTAGGSVGAFPISNLASRDAMLLLSLAPGSYSAEVSGLGGGGMALVEIYEVP